MIKDALGEIGAVTFIAVRFTVAFVVLAAAALLRGGRAGELRASVRPGLIAGLALFGGYLLQTLGLRSTSAARAGFITGLSVVLVPPLAWLLSREPLRRRALAALPPAVAGLALLSFSHPEAGGAAHRLIEAPSGDLLVLGCAACFALQIVLLARLTHPARGRRLDPLLLTLWQTLAVAAGALVLLPWGGGDRGTPPAWAAAAALGVAGTAGAYLVQALAQRYVRATRTALIYTAEPLFAALFAAAFGGEALGAAVVVGGGCIVGAMLLGS